MDITPSVLPHTTLAHAAVSPALEPTIGVAPATGAAGQSRNDSATSEQARHAPAQVADEQIEDINHSLRAFSTNLRFDIDPDIQRLVVSVVDVNSGEVLRTVPNEVVLRLAKMMVQLQGQVVSTEV